MNAGRTSIIHFNDTNTLIRLDSNKGAHAVTIEDNIQEKSDAKHAISYTVRKYIVYPCKQVSMIDYLQVILMFRSGTDLTTSLTSPCS